MSPLAASRLRDIYDSVKKWIAYAALVVAFVCLYFGDLLGPIRDFLFPASILVVVGIVVETLQNLENNLIGRQNGQEFASTGDAINALSALSSSYRDLLQIEVIASSGGTTINSLLPALLHTARARRIDVRLNLINPDSPFGPHFPDHWAAEVRGTLDRLQRDYAEPRQISLTVYMYDYLPVIHGVLINEKHLLIGFFGWTHFPDGQLSGAQRPHRLYRQRDFDSNEPFELFEDWLRNAPSRLVFTNQAAQS